MCRLNNLCMPVQSDVASLVKYICQPTVKWPAYFIKGKQQSICRSFAQDDCKLLTYTVAHIDIYTGRIVAR